MNEFPDHPEEPVAPDPVGMPKVPVRIEEACAAAAMALICGITFANVVVRYFTDVSFAFTEEFSIFLMVVLTLFGTAAAVVRNSHIRMTFLVERLPKNLARVLEYLVLALMAVMFALVAWYGWFLFWDDWQYETTSPGIGIPQWIYTIWLPLLSALVVLRVLGRLVRFHRSRP